MLQYLIVPSLVQLEVTLNYLAGVKLKRLTIAIFRVTILKSDMAAIWWEFQVAPKRKRIIRIENRIMYNNCAKFGAFFTKRITPLKKIAMPLH